MRNLKTAQTTTGNRLEQSDAAARRLLEELVAFCRERGGEKCFHNWPEEIVRQYVAFHILHRTLGFVRCVPPGPSAGGAGGTGERQIVGIGILWQMDGATFWQRHNGHQHVFRWEPTDEAGDSLCAGEWICAAPGVLRALVRHFKRRFPDWRRLTFIPVQDRRKATYAH